MSGEAHVDGVPLLPGSMLYLGCGRTELPLRAESDAGLMLLGGEPFEEELVMWWNFDRTVPGGDRAGPRGLDGGHPVRRGEGLRRRPAARPGAAARAVEAARQGALTCRNACVLVT